MILGILFKVLFVPEFDDFCNFLNLCVTSDGPEGVSMGAIAKLII